MRRLEAASMQKILMLQSMPAGSVFHRLASASEKLPLPCLGLTVSVSLRPWCASALARADSDTPTAPVTTMALTPSSLLIFMFTVSGLLAHFTNSLEHLLPLPRHCLALHLSHLASLK